MYLHVHIDVWSVLSVSTVVCTYVLYPAADGQHLYLHPVCVYCGLYVCTVPSC